MKKTISYDLGSTVYGQPLLLTWCQGSAGEKQWVLRQEPANQRDDGNVIAGLTDEVIEQMWNAVQDKRKQ